jgi:branched-chain amino acid transport system substrate-binding protein
MTSISRLSAVFLLALMSLNAYSQTSGVSDNVVKIGVLTDMSGFLSDVAGEGSLTAVRMAAEDFGGKVLGKPIEVVFADNLNKADVASSKSREWFDSQQVDMIIDLGNSATALSTVEVAKAKNRIAIATAPGTTRITNENCGPGIVHYAYDTYALANGIAKTLVRQGLDTWYFVTIDFAGGHAIEKDASNIVKANDGKVVGAVRHPINAPDFSSFILQAQSSGAKVIGLATAGGDAINAIKTANEFGITKSGKQKLAGLYVFLSDIHSLGLPVVQDMAVTTGFYWDYNDATRKWSRKYFEKMKRMPTMVQAANYSATMHYLKSIQLAGTDDTTAVMKKMRETPINDFFAKNGTIREDGRMVHDMYLAQVKKPSESKYPWDYYSIKAVIPAAEAFQPLSSSTCSMVKMK